MDEARAKDRLAALARHLAPPSAEQQPQPLASAACAGSPYASATPGEPSSYARARCPPYTISAWAAAPAVRPPRPPLAAPFVTNSRASNTALPQCDAPASCSTLPDPSHGDARALPAQVHGPVSRAPAAWRAATVPEGNLTEAGRRCTAPQAPPSHCAAPPPIRLSPTPPSPAAPDPPPSPPPPGALPQSAGRGHRKDCHQPP